MYSCIIYMCLIVGKLELATRRLHLYTTAQIRTTLLPLVLGLFNSISGSSKVSCGVS